MKKTVLLLLVSVIMIITTVTASAQLIVGYNFNLGDTTTPVVSHLTCTPANRMLLSPGPVTSGVLQNSGFTTSATPDQSQYVEVTITVEAGYILALDSMSFNTQRSSAGPTQIYVGYGVAQGISTYSTPITPPSSSSGTLFRWNFPDTTVGSGATIRLRFYGWASLATGGSARLDNINLYGNVTSSLPVKLTSFNAAAGNNQVNLNWITAQEINNSHFEIERSNDGKSFSNLGSVRGAGNSSKTNSYTFTDHNITQTGSIYYRLKQVDFDGQFEYSKQVVIQHTETFACSVFPNPLTDLSVLRYQLTSASACSITIINQLGQPVWQFSKNETPAGVYEVNLPELTRGIYVVDVTINGQRQTLKVIKN